jgi:serine O-acetyltransferase
MGNLKIDVKKSYKILLKTENPPLIKRVIAWVWRFDLHCVTVYRFGQWAGKVFKKNKILGFFPMFFFLIFDFIIRLFHHVDISYRAKIGPGLYLGHPTNILIGPTTIGKNCSMTHNVTIGWGVGSQKPGVPVIGDNVWIGPGSVLTGGIEIGNGVTISAGSVLNKSIPDNCLVAGNPARLVLKEYDNSGLMKFKVE